MGDRLRWGKQRGKLLLCCYMKYKHNTHKRVILQAETIYIYTSIYKNRRGDCQKNFITYHISDQHFEDIYKINVLNCVRQK